MSWKEILEAQAAREEVREIHRGEQQRQERSKLELKSQEADIIAEGILKEFGVVQALADVKEDVWEEGKITRTRNKRGWELVSDPVETLEVSRLQVQDLRRKDLYVITLKSESIVLGIHVEFENRDPAEPKLVLRDNGGPIRLKEHILKEERMDMLRVLRILGWKGLARNIQEGLKLNQRWSFSGSNQEVSKN